MVLYSECFYDEGLKLSAFQIGVENDNLCKNCGSKLGRKLEEVHLTQLAHRFFVWGTLHRCDYGAAPIQNLALFAKPLKESKIGVKCINRLVLHTIEYGVHFGTVEY